MPGTLMSYFLLAWLAALVALVGYRLLTDQINMQGLMSYDDGSFAPERAQLLAATMAGVIVYAQQAIANQALVDPPAYLLQGMAASNLLYLGGKSIREFVQPRA